MKKLLGILGAVTFTLAPAASVISCGNGGSTASDNHVLGTDIKVDEKDLINFGPTVTITEQNAITEFNKKTGSKVNAKAVNVSLADNKLTISSNDEPYYDVDAKFSFYYVDSQITGVDINHFITEQRFNSTLHKEDVKAGDETFNKAIAKLVGEHNPHLVMSNLVNNGYNTTPNNRFEVSYALAENSVYEITGEDDFITFTIMYAA